MPGAALLLPLLNLVDIDVCVCVSLSLCALGWHSWRGLKGRHVSTCGAPSAALLLTPLLVRAPSLFDVPQAPPCGAAGVVPGAPNRARAAICGTTPLAAV